jgi:hypothetical protein
MLPTIYRGSRRGRSSYRDLNRRVCFRRVKSQNNPVVAIIAIAIVTITLSLIFRDDLSNRWI